MDTIGERIKALRKSESLTQKEFANRLLISQSYLSGVEKGNETPTNKLLKLIGLEFGVREEWLFNNSGEMYDDVYEHDKADLVEISNEALLKIMSLLSTKSNVEYGLYALPLTCFASILKQGRGFTEDDKLAYLELIQGLVLDLERMMEIFIPHSTLNAISNKEPLTDETLQRHKKAISDDIDELLKFLMARNPKWEI